MFVFTNPIKTSGSKILFLCTAMCAAVPAFAQYVEHKGNDVTSPLHLLKPAYVTPYGETKMADVKVSLDRVYNYLDKTTPFELIDKVSGKVVSDLKKADSSSIFKPGDYRLTSYEWGVTYTGMLEAAIATGDQNLKIIRLNG
ncbi:glycoside hydrolase family 88 protein [Pedobacter kyonggii]|uniref:glycoside hydrolase family 88 protein n=1 Tax=Pedobacter kyonggii TaxID=1926871 RepID=UPI001FC9DE96|nr:glycoside hydrolase family 88 protein [Pedobacter kyonggii]